MQPSTFPGFQRLFEDLLRFGLSRNVPFQDTEDLVGATIESALRHFDATKGAFRSLCFTTLSNLIKNYWRDGKRSGRPPEGEDPVDPDWEEGFAWQKNEEEKMRLEGIMTELTPDEKAFLLQLRDVYGELEDRAVSEASRRLGIAPQKGWDIFRRIQRKARKMPPQIRASVSGPAAIGTEMREIDAGMREEVASETPLYLRRVQTGLSPDLRSLANFTAGRTAFERLLAKFPERSVMSIESLL